MAVVSDRRGFVLRWVAGRLWREAFHLTASLIYQSGVDEFQVAGFETGDYLAFVVSDLPPQRNTQFASNVAPTVHEFLSGVWRGRPRLPHRHPCRCLGFSCLGERKPCVGKAWKICDPLRHGATRKMTEPFALVVHGRRRSVPVVGRLKRYNSPPVPIRAPRSPQSRRRTVALPVGRSRRLGTVCCPEPPRYPRPRSSR